MDSIAHYLALNNLFRGNVAVAALTGDKSAIEELRQRVVALDDAYANACRLNALVCKYVPDYSDVMDFHTS
jgi:hypothetical protein